EIQIDRYSATSPEAIAVSFLEDANPNAGWKTTFSAPQAWVRFNEVDFGRGALKSVDVRAKAGGRSALEIHLDRPDGPLLGRVKVSGATDWKVAQGKVK